MSDLAAFARVNICSTFIDSVPLTEIVRATSTVEMALSLLMHRRKEWEDTFIKKFGVPVDGEVELPKMIAAFCVMAQCSLDLEGVGFVKSAPVPAHEYVSRFWDKEEFTDVTLDDLASLMDSDAADTEVWCLESINDDEIDRLKAFVLAVWTFTVTSLSAYRGKKGSFSAPQQRGQSQQSCIYPLGLGV